MKNKMANNTSEHKQQQAQIQTPNLNGRMTLLKIDNDSNIKYKIFLHPNSLITNFLISMSLSPDVSRDEMGNFPGNREKQRMVDQLRLGGFLSRFVKLLSLLKSVYYPNHLITDIQYKYGWLYN